MTQNSQFKLLTKRRFLPLFITHVFEMLDDKFYKNALIVLLVYQLAATEANTLVNIASSLYIFPFFLLSASAGQIADKYDKGSIIRILKVCEIIFAIIGVTALFTKNYTLGLAAILLYGIHATFYSATKYALLPQHLHRDELLSGNALVQMGSFSGTLIGTIIGILLIGMTGPGQYGLYYIALALIGFAFLGLLASFAIPPAPPPTPGLKVNWNPISHTLKVLHLTTQTPAVFYSILAVAWFWMLTTAYLAQVPSFTKNILKGDEQVITLLLCSLTVGTAAGSLLCSSLSKGRIELGIVPIGAIGVTASGLALGYLAANFDATANATVHQFILNTNSYPILIAIALFGIFGGIFSVPLYAVIQDRATETIRGQVISISNVVNAFFMAVAALFDIFILDFIHIGIPEFFVIVALMNIVIVTIIFSREPELATRMLLWVPTHTLCHISLDGLDKIPTKGPALIISNHVSYLDPLLLADAVQRPIRFITHQSIYQMPMLHFLFRTNAAIPIPLKGDDPKSRETALQAIEDGLKKGEIMCIFPEGKITLDGNLQPFLKDVEEILERTTVPVIPIALQGLWGSIFSPQDTRLPKKQKRRFFPKVNIIAGEPIDGSNAKRENLRRKIAELRGDQL
ncbi:MFS transporter [Microbulbifer sp. EKSA008]|uniref:MFS transporter n=1 Tax=unclassified Microbulbifer TaxID=2619833 RepID=UPI004039AB7F